MSTILQLTTGLSSVIPLLVHYPHSFTRSTSEVERFAHQTVLLLRFDNFCFVYVLLPWLSRLHSSFVCFYNQESAQGVVILKIDLIFHDVWRQLVMASMRNCLGVYFPMKNGRGSTSNMATSNVAYFQLQNSTSEKPTGDVTHGLSIVHLIQLILRGTSNERLPHFMAIQPIVQVADHVANCGKKHVKHARYSFSNVRICFCFYM